MTSTTNQSKASAHQVVVTILSVVIVLLLILSITMWFSRPRSATVVTVTNFDQCKDAGGALLESYPEQCLINGTTFVNSKQQVSPQESYVGMTEEDALAKAAHDKTSARVVQRDGKSLPMTMDFVQGRHNFTITDGKVTSVEIEGQATDTSSQE